MHEQGSPHTALALDLVFDVLDFPVRAQFPRVDQIASKESRNPAHAADLILAISEDHMGVWTDKREAALIVGDEDRI